MFGRKRNRIEISETNIEIQGNIVFIINSLVHLLTELVDEKKITPDFIRSIADFTELDTKERMDDNSEGRSKLMKAFEKNAMDCIIK